jgi:hypothetical protein
MAFIGVLISWLMLARKALLARVARFGSLLRLAQFLLGALAFADVADEGDEARRFAIALAGR